MPRAAGSVARRALSDRRGADHRRASAAGTLRDPYRRAGLAWRRLGRTGVAGGVLRELAAAWGGARSVVDCVPGDQLRRIRSEEHTSELQSLMRISYAVFCLKKKNTHNL